MRIESQRGRLHAREALKNKSRCAQKQQGQRNLDNHEPVPAPPRSLRFRTAERSGLQCSLDIGPRHLPCRPESEQDCRERREQEVEGQHAEIETDLFETRRRCWSECDERIASPNPKEQTQRPSDCGDGETFDQQLSDDSAMRRADSRANGKLSRARSASRRKKIGEIRAGDQQNQGDRAEQQTETRSVTAEKIIEKRFHGHACARVRCRICFLETRGDCFHLGAHLFECHAGL